MNLLDQVLGVHYTARREQFPESCPTRRMISYDLRICRNECTATFVPNPRVEAAIEYGLGLKLDVPWETNGQGQLIVNPPIGLAHAKRADKLIATVRRCLSDWQVWPEVGIHTADGIKAPNLALASPSFTEQTDSRGFLVQAPEVCVEIMSSSDTWEEMRHKTSMYLAVGAEEVWICDESGALHFFDRCGQILKSQIAQDVPDRVD